MSAWLGDSLEKANKFLESRNVQLAAVAVVSGSVVASTILGYQAIRHHERVKSLKASIPTPNEEEPDSEEPNKTEPSNDASRQPQSSQPKSSQPKSSQPNSLQHIPGVDNRLAVATSREDAVTSNLAAAALKNGYDQRLIVEQLARTKSFLKDDGLHKLRSSFVIIVGCGGVGSHAAAALARSGVSKLRLVDFDQITLSSLNRHAVATLADVGTNKVHCIRRRLEATTPWVEFDCKSIKFENEVAKELLGHWNGVKPSYIIDAIDDLNSKLDLLQYCYWKKLPVVSSMGAGCKSDPTRVFIGDISCTSEDPLSRSTRQLLNKVGIQRGIPVVYSTEKAGPDKATLLPLPDEEYNRGDANELAVLPKFRARILPVLGTMPAVFGLCLANYVMLEVAGYPHEEIQFKDRDKMYEGILAHLQGTEQRLASFFGYNDVGLRLPVSVSDVGYIVEEVYRGRSVVSGLSSRLTLIRWTWNQDSSPFVKRADETYSVLALGDLVCMTKKEARHHEEQVLRASVDADDFYEDSVVECVKKRKSEEMQFSMHR